MSKIYSKLIDLFSKISKFFPERLTAQVGIDKIYHAIAGFLLSLFGLFLHLAFGFSVLVIILLPVVIGILKEVVDYILNRIAISRSLQPPHGVELIDAIATILGGVPLFLLVYFWPVLVAFVIG